MEPHPDEETKYIEEEKATTKKRPTMHQNIDVNPIHTDSFFEKNQKKLTPIELSISNTHLIIHEKPKVNIYYGNILGASIRKMEDKEKKTLYLKETDEYHIIVIHFYSKISKEKLFGGESITRKAFDGEYVTDSAEKATKWRNLILQVANNPSFLDNLSDLSFNTVPEFKRTLLVFVNPIGGAGKAVKKWEKAKAMLELAGCDFVEIRTQYYKHCLEYLQKAELSELKKFGGIVTVSGDGLPHEVINGLMSRPDWQEACTIPLGALPGGSGNAITKNMCDRAGEGCSLESCCYLIAKGRTTPIDLAKLEQSTGQKIYSFLSFNWAVIADLDLESEKLRWMGGFRFDVMGAARVLSLRKYQAKIAISETVNQEENMPKIDQDIPQEGWRQLDDTFLYFCVNNMPYITQKDCNAPPAQIDDGYLHYTAIHGANAKRGKLLSSLLKLQGGLFKNGVPEKSTGMTYEKIKAFRIEPHGNRLGVYSIDGERYEPVRTQGFIMEKVFNVFCVNTDQSL